MTTAFENHVLQIFVYARHTVLWIAIALLIKVHTDVRQELTTLQATVKSFNLNNNLNPTAQAAVSIPSANALLSKPRLSDYVYGDLRVQGCILWEQPLGVFQNSCTIVDQLHFDCVHGIMRNTSCVCDPNWWGNLCDMHDCFGRGKFSVSTQECSCNEANLDVYCGKTSPGNENTCDLIQPVCDGTCGFVEGAATCVCTKTGQLGPACRQCASPYVDYHLCPGRQDWGKHYVDPDFKYGVCGGGYVPFSPNYLIIRAKLCLHASCLDFYIERAICCNPLAHNTSFCMAWLSFTYDATYFPAENTVFNSGYQQQYMAIVNAHDPFSPSCEETPLACLLRADHAISSADWPLLRVGSIPNQGYTIKRDQFYLGFPKTASSFSHYQSAAWTTEKTQLYLKPTGQFRADAQLHFIFSYQGANAFCLGGRLLTADIYALMFTKQYEPLDALVTYWVNLRDQPGQALDPDEFCATFLVDLAGKIVARSDTATSLYLGPWYGQGVYFYQKQYTSSIQVA